MIDDISKSIKASLYDRVTSPLFGAFAISFLFWNYKTVLILFSSMSALEKIDYIENTIYKGYWALTLNGGVFPLLSAILFIFIYPKPAELIYEYWNKRQRDLKIIRQKIEDETPITIEEGRVLRRNFTLLEKKYDGEIQHKSQEILDLNKTIKKIRSSEKIMESELKDKSEYLEDREFKIQELNENIKQLKSSGKILDSQIKGYKEHISTLELKIIDLNEDKSKMERKIVEHKEIIDDRKAIIVEQKRIIEDQNIIIEKQNNRKGQEN